MKPKITMETVTPKQAAEWLGSSNTTNRKISKQRVNQLARDIAEGRWLFSGAPIIFGEDTLLKDGQHRLAAIVQSDTALQMVVVRNVPNEAFHVIDIGKVRTAGDILTIQDIASPGQVSSVSRLLVMYNTDRTTSWESIRARMTKTETIQFAEQNKDALLHAVNTLNRWHEVPRWAGIGAAAFLIQQANGEDVFTDTEEGIDWNDKLCNGTMLEPASATHNLIRQFRLMKSTGGGTWRNQQSIMLTLRAWEYHCTGKKSEHLRVSRASLPMQEAYVLPARVTQ